MTLLSLFHQRDVLKMLAFVVLQYHYEEIAVFDSTYCTDFSLADKYVNHTSSFFLSLSLFFPLSLSLSREFHLYACLFIYKGGSSFINFLLYILFAAFSLSLSIYNKVTLVAVFYCRARWTVMWN